LVICSDDITDCRFNLVVVDCNKVKSTAGKKNASRRNKGTSERKFDQQDEAQFMKAAYLFNSEGLASLLVM